MCLQGAPRERRQMPQRQETVQNSMWELSERQSKQEMLQEWGGGLQASFSNTVCLEPLPCAQPSLEGGENPCLRGRQSHGNTGLVGHCTQSSV